MSITALWRAVRGHWHDLVGQFWPDSPEERTEAEIARLRADLSRRHRRLVRLRLGIERARARLGRVRRRLNEVPDEKRARLRRSAQRLEERLTRLEGAYRDGCRELRRRKRLCQDLERGRAQVVGVVRPAGGSEAV